MSVYITELFERRAKIWYIQPDDGSRYFQVEDIPMAPESPEALMLVDFDTETVFWSIPPKLPLSPTEHLQQENRLLSARVQALSERGDFLDDCLAEMAGQVYQ